MEWFTIFLVFLALYLIAQFTKKPKNFPPGPPILPFVGSGLSLAFTKGETQHDLMWNVSRKYGPIVGLYLGSMPVVLISGYKTIKYVLSREEFSFRPNFIIITSQPFNRRLGVFFTDGHYWREQRRFILRHLRDFGFGKKSMESLIHEEARVLLQEVEKMAPSSHQAGANLSALLPILAINVLWTIMAGKRHDIEDVTFKKLTDKVMSFIRQGNPTDPVLLSPNLQKIPIINSNYKKQRVIVDEIKDFIQATIDEHIKTYDENYMRDFMDVYIKEIKDNPDSTFSVDQLCASCIDLFNAGTETTASTLSYALRYLVQNPNVQRKLRKEVHQTVGTDKLPGMDDVLNLPYTQAVIAETLRRSGLIPLAPPHAVSAESTETQLLDYTLPKDCLVIVNLWSAHMDPEIWGDPYNFRPERFITDDGLFKKDEHLMAFGFGPRMCLGEPLARFSTVMFLAALIQRFNFEPFGPTPSDEQMAGFTTSPAPYLLKITQCV